MGATEALGTALYSSGHFERALVEFHKVNRRRQNIYDDWITRCEETIKAFLAASNIEIEIVTGNTVNVYTGTVNNFWESARH